MVDSSPNRILVVESDAIVLALITHILTRRGFDVEPRTDLGAFDHTGGFAVVLLDSDLVSPNAVRELLHLTPSLSGRVILTGSIDPPADPGICSVLPKPIDFSVMVELVRGCVSPPD